MGGNVVDSAVPLDIPLREYRRRLGNARSSWRPGLRVPGVRDWVLDSWEAMAARRISEQRVLTDPVSEAELELRRRDPMLAPIISMVEEELTGNVDGMFAVVDVDCRLLTVGGATAARNLAMSSGLAAGFDWSSDNSGCTGISSAMERGLPVQMFADDHWCGDQRELVCSVVPLYLRKRLVAAVNITEHWTAARRATLFMLSEFGAKIQERLAADERVRQAWRGRAAKLIDRCSGAALVINKSGEVLAARDVADTRVELPAQVSAGVRSLPRLGRCLLEPVPDIDGWLVRLVRDGEAPVLRVVLDFRDPNRKWVRVRGAGEWDREITRERFVEVLTVLRQAPAGLSASELAATLPRGNPDGQANARTLMWGLRDSVGPLFGSEPYRFADGIVVELREPSANP